MIDVLHRSAYKINVILIIMLKSKVLCDVVGRFPVDVDRPTPLSVQNFTEYFIEHNVTQRDAGISFRLHADDLLKKKAPAWCTRIPCTTKILQYCLGTDMLHDHCCCDSRHGREQFPWLPHSCYVGETCKPITGSCILYTDIRECCCDRAIAKQWETVFSSSTRTAVQMSFSLFLYVLAFVTL